VKLLTPIRYNLITRRGNIAYNLDNTTNKLNHKLNEASPLTQDSVLQYDREYVIEASHPIIGSAEGMVLHLPRLLELGQPIVVTNNSINDIQIHSNRLAKRQRIINYSFRSPTSHYNDILLITMLGGNSYMKLKAIPAGDGLMVFKLYDYQGIDIAVMNLRGRHDK
jgi:hypothetical protein